MPKSLLSKDILDRPDSLELMLDLNSFAGGENKIGADHELKNNEARTIECWEANSLGSMIRSKGFNQVGDGSKSIEAVVFTGSGLDDGTSGGTYSGTATATYDVEIDATGTPDTFKWRKDAGGYTSGVSITGGAQTLSDGVTITFAATTGHTLGDVWSITAVYYTLDLDFLIQHFEGTTTEVYGVIEGDLVILDNADLDQEDANAFTTGLLCHGVSAGSALWITNTTDNLQRKTIGVAIAAASGQPASARARIYEHKSRLIAEGGGVTVYGSRAGTGNWNSANTWSASGDAWSIDLADLTQGAVPSWPSGGEVTVFTKFGAFALSGFPNVVQRPIQPSYGCSAPHSIARGPEGVFYLSEYPTKAIVLWNGVNFINLTEFHDFVDDINLSQRVFGIYRNYKYHIFYNETGSGVNYPNRWRIYDTRFGRWMQRTVNSDLSDTFGYPALLTKSNNELYVGSSQKDLLYDLETTDTDDEGNNTQANYVTKEFTSQDFLVSGGGGQFPKEGVRIKLIKAVIDLDSVDGTLSLNWSIERGRITGAKTVDLSAGGVSGDVLNTTFTVNSSSLATVATKRKAVFSFPNNATGYSFSLQLLNEAQGVRPEIRRIRIFATAIDEL